MKTQVLWTKNFMGCRIMDGPNQVSRIIHAVSFYSIGSVTLIEGYLNDRQRNRKRFERGSTEIVVPERNELEFGLGSGFSEEDLDQEVVVAGDGVWWQSSSGEDIYFIASICDGKKRAVHMTTPTDDKRLQSTLKRIGVNAIPAIEEVNACKDDVVIQFINPKVQASIAANNWVVSGSPETKRPDNLDNLRN